MKILPINKDPYIRVYPEYAFQDMIINNAATTGDLITMISVQNECIESWYKNAEKAVIITEENIIKVNQKYYNNDKEKQIYRILNDNDELVIHIDYQQYTNRWDSIGLFIDNNLNNFKDYSKMKYVCGIHCGETMYEVTNGKIDVFWNECTRSKPSWIKIKYESKKITSFYSYDGQEWILISSKSKIIDKENNIYYIGIVISMNDNQYYKWIFNNFIQLKLSTSSGLYIDYCSLLERNSKHCIAHALLNTISENKQIINDYGIDMFQYIKCNIDNNRYIMIWLDEFYIPQLSAYKKYTYYHESLIYGYDEGNLQLYLVSFKGGKPKTITVSIEQLMQASRKSTNQMYIFEYSPNNNLYEIDIAHIFSNIRDYLEGFNSAARTNYIYYSNDGVYGINIYNELLKSENQDNFLADERIPYLLYEHKKCMYDRFNYLFKYGIISASNKKEILNYLENIRDEAHNMLYLVIKFQISKKEIIKTSVFNILKNIKNNEEICYSMILEIVIPK